jgi:hypothetical protein
MVRKMGSFDVLQRTKDGYFDANALLSQWNARKDNPERRISRFLDSPKTKEFINEIQKEIPSAEMHNGIISAFYEKKGRNTSKGRTKDEIWMHPYLFIDFAMWLNPKFKLSVIKFVYDQLIKQRTLAGDNYKTLSSSIVKLKGYSFQEVAKAIQWIVYNKIGKELRQTATQEQLQEINEIQTKLAFAIDMNYITTYEQLLNEMRKMYNKKYQKF